LPRTILLDIDGTLLPRSLEQWFISFLLRSRRIKPVTLVKNFCSLSAWPSSLQSVRLFYLRQETQESVQGWIEEAWRSIIVKKIYPAWPVVLEQLQARGITIVLLSGTLEALAGPVERSFGIDNAICAEPEIVGGIYTGRLLRPHPQGRRKLTYAEKWLSLHGSSLKDAIAVANDWPDRHLLSACRGIVIRPRRRLRSLARRRDWPIVDNLNNPAELSSAFTRLLG